MNTKLIMITVLGALVLTAGAEEFYLKHDKTGKVYGPFSTTPKTKVSVDNTTFTVVQKSLSEVERKLSQIIISETSFRNANVRDTIAWLRTMTAEFDPKRTGVNFVMIEPKPDKTKENKINRSYAEFINKGRPVNITLLNASSLQILKLIMEKSGNSYETSKNTVTIHLTN